MAKKRFRPILIPNDVKVNTSAAAVKVQGPLGVLERTIIPKVTLSVEGDKILVKNIENSKAAAAQQGTMRAHVANMIKGVVKGYEKVLVIEGTGYRAQLAGSGLQLFLGYSKPKIVDLPKAVKCELKVVKSAEKGDLTYITLKSIDKELLGDIAALVRRMRIPDPYKHKGVRYATEVLRKKVGKRAVVQA